MKYETLNNARHNFGYIQLPTDLTTHFPEDKEAICWSPFALIEKEIHESEVDVMVNIGTADQPLVYRLGKAVELKTSVGQRFLKIDTTEMDSTQFHLLREYVLINRPVCRNVPFLASLHIDSFITDVHLVATNLPGEPEETVLNMIVITLL